MEATIIKKDGKATMDKDFNFMLSLLRNGEYTLTIKRKTKPRTLDQNALMWMWFRCVGGALREFTGEAYWSTKEGVETIHDLYCKKFLTKMVITPKGERTELARGTKGLSTMEMSHFLDAVKTDIMTEYGIQLPLPTDKYYSAFAAEYEDKF